MHTHVLKCDLGTVCGAPESEQVSDPPSRVRSPPWCGRLARQGTGRLGGQEGQGAGAGAAGTRVRAPCTLQTPTAYHLLFTKPFVLKPGLWPVRTAGTEARGAGGQGEPLPGPGLRVTAWAWSRSCGLVVGCLGQAAGTWPPGPWPPSAAGLPGLQMMGSHPGLRRQQLRPSGPAGLRAAAPPEPRVGGCCRATQTSSPQEPGPLHAHGLGEAQPRAQ